MIQSGQLNELLADLAKAQAELQNVQKDSTNPFFKSSYASLAACLDVARPVLAKHNLSYQQIVGGESPNICVTSILGHSSGQFMGSSLCMQININAQNAAQEAGKVITYLRRYMLTAQVGLAQEDDDAQSAPASMQPQQAQQVSHISEEQLAELEKLAKEAGLLVSYIAGQYKVASLKNLPADKFENVRNRLQSTIEKNEGKKNE